jgi:hypothetical protein
VPQNGAFNFGFWQLGVCVIPANIESQALKRGRKGLFNWHG